MLRRTRRALLLSGIALLAFAGNAQARQIQQYFFNGERFDAGGSSPAAMALDATDHKILIVGNGDKEHGLKIGRFNLNGDPAGFSGREEATSFHTGVPFTNPPNVAIAVDESGTASNGNFYVTSQGTNDVIYGYAPSGTLLPGFPAAAPGACGVTVAADSNIWVASMELGSYSEITPQGQLYGKSLFVGRKEAGCQIAVDAAGNFYVSKGEQQLAKYDPDRHLIAELGRADPIYIAEASPRIAIDRSDNALFELYVPQREPGNYSRVLEMDDAGHPLTNFGEPDPAHFSYEGLDETSHDIAVDSQTHDVYVLAENEVNVFSRDPNVLTVPTLSAREVEILTATSATLTASVDPNGVDTTDCHFEWGGPREFGKFGFYKQSVPCSEGNVFTGGSGENVVSAPITGLTKGTRYHYRLSAENANGVPAYSVDHEFRAADPPSISGERANRITTDTAWIGTEINTNGADSKYHIEIGTDTSYGTSFPVPDAKLATSHLDPQFEGEELLLTPQAKTQEIRGLQPDTLYHYRVVAKNLAGRIEGEDHVFRTFAPPSSGEDKCPNAQARQETSAAGLLDCRGYELVSAPDTGGYDVRSGLSVGTKALATSPQADDATLYSLRSGTIPGIAGHPTNRGADPYLAARGENGWSTRYVGLASNNPFATGPFASSLSGFDRALDTFSLGGQEICQPCFEDGSTNAPLRLPDGSLVQGMAGSMNPGPAEPAGVLAKPLSADGSHFVFGTTAQFEPSANSNGTDATIYSRDLQAKSTEAISTDAAGDALQNGKGIAELDVSKDGSRTVIGEKLTTDAAGNAYYHLYLHIAGTPESVDLMPGATEGALFDGMSEDGTDVFFVTTEPLTGSDNDTSADVYRDVVPGPGITAPQILSQGAGAGNTDACTPPGSPNNWNAVSGNGKCNVVAFAGGAGVASESGDFYFLSPELLDGPSNGTQDQANLYLVKAGTTTPHFVATIDSSLVKPPPPPPIRPVVTGEFAGSPRGPEAMTVDQSNGDVYVIETFNETARFSRYTASGNPDNFSEGPGAGTNSIPGLTFVEIPYGITVDNSGGLFDGDVYVTNYSNVSVFSQTGKPLGQLTGFSEACGVAVDQSDGNVYVSELNGHIWRYSPTSGSLPLSNANYAVTGIATGVEPCSTAADDGNVYAATIFGGPVRRFEASSFSASSPFVSGSVVDNKARGLASDPVTHELYVNEANKIGVFNPAGERQITLEGEELLGSRGVAVNATSHHVYGSRPFAGSIIEFGYEGPPDEPIDNPAVLHGVRQSGIYDSSDFQVTPSGDYVAFTTLVPLSGYPNGGHYELFRYQREGGDLTCVSCSESLATAESDATLAPGGLSLLEDGRVFFTTGEQLSLRDTNEKRDAYEWENGKQELVSTGTSANDSELLSVSSDGKNALFFTRQKLVPEDENGGNVRLYTAREGGGFEFGPPEFQCAASDECHGASTKAPPPLAAGTTAGTPGQFEEAKKPARCAKGKVKRKGKCVKTHKRHGHKRAAKHKRGAGK